MKNDKRILAMMFASFFLFAVLALLVKSGLTQSFDQKLNIIYSSFDSEFIFALSMLSHYAFGSESLLIISIIVAGYLVYARRKTEAYMLVTGMLIDVALVYALKHLIERPRPLINMIMDSGFSFPSGHTTAAMVFFGLIALILISKYKNHLTRGKIEIGLGLLIGFVGFTRIYLGVHYFTDVFGGFLLGTGILCLVIYLFKKQNLFFSFLKK